MSTSITAVNAKLIADAKQFIAEFERAHAGSRKAVAKIDSEMDKLVRSVKKKFSGSEFAKGLLGGLGVGSGAATVLTGVNLAQDYFAKRDAANKEHEASLARQAELAKDIDRLYMTDEGKLAALRGEAGEAFAKLQAAQAAGGGTDARKQVDELTEAYQKLTLEVAKAEKEISDRNVADHIARMDQAKAIDDELKKLGFQGTMDAFKVGGQQRSVTELKAERDRMAVERNELRGQIGGDPEETARRQIELGERIIQTQTRINELTDEHKRLAREVGETVVGSFEEAAFSGGKLGDVVKGLILDLARLFFRQQVTAPLGAAIGNIFGRLFPARAAGGPVGGGSPYLVGERGPELFVPETSGRIVPNHALASGGGGNVYQIDARGTDESVVQRLQAALFALAGPGVVERRALAAHASTLRRGGGAARALGA